MAVYKSTQRAVLLIILAITVIIQAVAFSTSQLWLSIGTSIAMIVGLVFILPRADERTPHVSGTITPKAARRSRENVYGPGGAISSDGEAPTLTPILEE